MKKTFIAHALAAAIGFGMLGQAHANSTLQDGIVAAVNDEIVLQSELNSAIAAFAGEYPSLSTEELHDLALNTLINRKLQLGLIKRAGIVANDDVINRQLLQIAQSQGFSSLSQMQATLDAQKPGSYAAIRSQLIEDFALEALSHHQLSERIKISDQEIQSLLNSDTPEAQSIKDAQAQYQLMHVRVPIGGDANAQMAAAQQVAAAMQQGQTLEQILGGITHTPQLQGTSTAKIPASALPEHIAAKVTTLPVGGVAMAALGGHIDVVQLVHKDTEARILLPEWRTSHILAKVDGTHSAAFAEEKINAIYTQLQNGANFAELAATYSDDAGSAQQRGSLGWVGEGQMVPEFERVMKNTQKSDYSTPFRSQFGWHILKVDDVRQKDVTDQYRKNVAKEIIFSRLAPQAQEDWIQEMRAGAYIKIFK